LNEKRTLGAGDLRGDVERQFAQWEVVTGISPMTKTYEWGSWRWHFSFSSREAVGRATEVICEKMDGPISDDEIKSILLHQGYSRWDEDIISSSEERHWRRFDGASAAVLKGNRKLILRPSSADLNPNEFKEFIRQKLEEKSHTEAVVRCIYSPIPGGLIVFSLLTLSIAFLCVLVDSAGAIFRRPSNRKSRTKETDPTEETPVPERKIVTTVVSLPIDLYERNDVEKSNQAFHGSMTMGTVIDVIQFKSMTRCTTMLEFSTNSNMGRIYLRDGDVVHAELEGWHGMPALEAICRWRGGSAREVSGEVSAERTIDTPWSSLVLELCQAMDESEAQEPPRI